MKALEVAAHHYRELAGWHWPTGVHPMPRVADLARAYRYAAEVCELPDDVADAVLRDCETVRAYAYDRLPPMRGTIASTVGAVMGVAPSPRSGLADRLASVGGTGLVDAATRAGLLRSDGSEALARRVVFVWTDVDGAPVYLTGRAVPGFTPSRGGEEAPRYLALPVFGAGADPARGVPRYRVPFALSLAARLPDPVVIVEGEIDALARTTIGRATVATGGTGRARPDDLARALAGRATLVAFDVEDDDVEQARTDERARNLAAALGARWVPGAKRRQRAEVSA